jgi:hypothetical protein
MDKRSRGQFYTGNCGYILEGFGIPENVRVIEPFAGRGDLLEWASREIIAYDIDPKHPKVQERDTLLDPPDYRDSWILTNPPYLARNKSDSKVYFDLYKTNDLYKCFIKSIKSCLGGIFIIPASFFLSPRNVDLEVRNGFLSKYRLLKVKYFEETVFQDTTTTVVAFQFELQPKKLTSQIVEWVCMPSGETKSFKMEKENDWIIGGNIYKIPVSPQIKVWRHVHGNQTNSTTGITLCALDSGKDLRIRLDYRPGYIYPAKNCSRTYATINVDGANLTPEEEQELCTDFNKLIEHHRKETWSLFLPQYRESKEYARKRIPFELVYRIINNLIQSK